MVDPAANWKTYTNNNLLFTFRYPEVFAINNVVSEDPQYKQDQTVLFGFELTNTKGQTAYTLSVFTPSLTSLGDWIKQNFNKRLPPEEDVSQQLQKQIGSLSVYEITYKYGTMFVFSDSKKRVYILGTNIGARGSSASQILSTFRFLDSPQTVQMTKKHYLSSDKFYAQNSYPQEITNLQDGDLIGFTCSNKYSKQLDGSFVFYNNDSQQNQKETLTDTATLSLLKTAEETAMQQSKNNSLLSATVCKTDAGKTLITYEITPGGGGAGASVYYGYFNGDNTAVAEIPMENGPYFSCSDILAITKFNTLYVICGAGDGGFGSKSLYRVGLMKAYVSDLLLKCTSIMADESSTPKIFCGTTQ